MIEKFDYTNIKIELNKLDKVIFEKDMDYRDKYIHKYYSKIPRNDVSEFMYFFCEHYNISKLGEQISNVFNSNLFDFDSMNYPQKFHKLCDIFSEKI